MDAITFIEKNTKTRPAPLFVVVGDEDFLRRQVLAKLTADLLGDADPAFALSTYEGASATWPTVRAELDTLPFLSPRRVVAIEAADVFVTANRGALERFALAEGGKGTLILEVKSWPANTKLAKQTPDQATIECKEPKTPRLIAWAKAWARNKHGKELAGDAADCLVELVGPGMGQLDQEMEKLATFAGDAPAITRAHVERLVGRTRQAETFRMFDAIGVGDAVKALGILHRLFEQGVDPLGILAPVGWQLRRLAAVSRLHRSGLPINVAMDRAGVPPFARAGLETQLRHLGKNRMDKVYDWLLATDSALKGGSQLPPHLILERLVIRLARKS